MYKKCLFVAALSAVACVTLNAAVFSEDFSSDPSSRGWKVYGNANLAQWDSTNHVLQFKWDSGQPNTYFHHPLGTMLGREDDFSVSFDLFLKDIGPGPDPTKTFSFGITVGLLNFSEATNATFLRGTGMSSPNLCEFDYFFDSGFGATVWPQLVDSNSTFNYSGANDYAVYAFNTNEWYHVVMNYTASNHAMLTTVSSASANFTINDPLASTFKDFRVDTISVTSFNDDQGYGSSVLANGAVRNISVTLPPLPVTTFSSVASNGVWTAQFMSRTNWTYTLQRSTDLKTWTDGVSAAGDGTAIQLQDSANGEMKFYRIKATR